MRGQTLFTQSEISSICVLRLSAIGDVCHALSMVQQLRARLPKASITWVVGKVEAKLLSGLVDVEFVVFDKSKGLAAYRDLKKQFKHRKFDVLLHMQVALRASLVSLCIPAKVKIGFDRGRAKEGQHLFTNHQITAQHQPHVLEGFHGFAKALGLDMEQPQWDITLHEAERDFVSQHFDRAGAPIAIISPAASKAERNWHVQGYSAAARHLHQKGFTVVFCGGPSDMERDLVKQIEGSLEFAVVNLVGKTNLKQLLAVIQHADMILSPDSGPAHMAVMVGTPVVGLYAHSNPLRTGPYLFQQYVVSAYDLAILAQYGKPWQQLPWGVRAKGDDLMDEISVSAVCEKIDMLVNDFYPQRG